MRRLLLDTHTVLWWLAGVPMAAAATDAIADPANHVAVSAASIWEIAIKRRIGKLHFNGTPGEEVRAAGFEQLSIVGAHAEAAGGLPLHHRDPFDRMLVAQAIVEDLVLVCRDAVFGRYDVQLLPC